MINAPVLHVNGDHPEGVYFLFSFYMYVRKRLMGNKDVVRAMDIAFRYRNYFRKVCLVTERVIHIKLTRVGHHCGSSGLSTMVCSSLPSIFSHAG